MVGAKNPSENSKAHLLLASFGSHFTISLFSVSIRYDLFYFSDFSRKTEEKLFSCKYKGGYTNNGLQLLRTNLLMGRATVGVG